jgi:hypothetical protein
MSIDTNEWSNVAGGGVAGAILMIVLWFLKPFLHKTTINGNTGEKPVTFWEDRLTALGDTITEKFDNSLKISVVPILNRQTEILDEMRKDNQELSRAIIKLGLRDEMREEIRRAKGATAH